MPINKAKYARQSDLIELKAEIKDIKENHLPHLRQAINLLRGQMWVLIPLVIAILTIVISVLIKI